MALMLAVDCIMFGGGVAGSGLILPYIRRGVATSLNGYLQPLSQAGALDRYITGPLLGDRAGITGALLLAESVAANRGVESDLQ